MFIPLSIFLYLYLAFLAIFSFFAFFGIYHIIRFSFWSFSAFLATFLFLAASVLILFNSFEYIKEVDWKKGFSLETNLDVSGIGTQTNFFDITNQ